MFEQKMTFQRSAVVPSGNHGEDGPVDGVSWNSMPPPILTTFAASLLNSRIKVQKFANHT
jgi:hypothetical protein